MTTVYDYSVRTGDGEDTSLSAYKGEVLLLVNVASKCGYTPQYEGLEQLYRTYKGEGFRILAFPCNDFGAQEPGTVGEIQEFCRTRYEVTFDIMDKIRLAGDEVHPLYKFLTSYTGDPGEVKWNFEKFLIARDGTIAGRFRSGVKPEDPDLVSAIEALK